MDYKRKYRDALSKVRELYGENVVLSSGEALHIVRVLESAFSELRESEDERNWRILKSIMHHNVSDDVYDYYDLDRDDFESWLEKQGKRSPFSKEMLMGVARPETFEEKVESLERMGFTRDEAIVKITKDRLADDVGCMDI